MAWPRRLELCDRGLLVARRSTQVKIYNIAGRDLPCHG